MNRAEDQKKVNELLKKFKNVEFKPEGLGALEFNVEMYSEKFKVEEIPFRIERVSLQVADKVLKDNLNKIEDMEKVLATFIAFPKEATKLSYFNLDYNAMSDIAELIALFQSTPFSFTEAARNSTQEVTK